jgi:hypothetical protein
MGRILLMSLLLVILMGGALLLMRAGGLLGPRRDARSAKRRSSHDEESVFERTLSERHNRLLGILAAVHYSDQTLVSFDASLAKRLGRLFGRDGRPKPPPVGKVELLNRVLSLEQLLQDVQHSARVYSQLPASIVGQVDGYLEERQRRLDG